MVKSTRSSGTKLHFGTPWPVKIKAQSNEFSQKEDRRKALKTVRELYHYHSELEQQKLDEEELLREANDYAEEQARGRRSRCRSLKHSASFMFDISSQSMKFAAIPLSLLASIAQLAWKHTSASAPSIIFNTAPGSTPGSPPTSAPSSSSVLSSSSSSFSSAASSSTPSTALIKAMEKKIMALEMRCASLEHVLLRKMKSKKLRHHKAAKQANKPGKSPLAASSLSSSASASSASSSSASSVSSVKPSTSTDKPVQQATRVTRSAAKKQKTQNITKRTSPRFTTAASSSSPKKAPAVVVHATDSAIPAAPAIPPPAPPLTATSTSVPQAPPLKMGPPAPRKSLDSSSVPVAPPVPPVSAVPVAPPPAPSASNTAAAQAQTQPQPQQQPQSLSSGASSAGGLDLNALRNVKLRSTKISKRTNTSQNEYRKAREETTVNARDSITSSALKRSRKGLKPANNRKSTKLARKRGAAASPGFLFQALKKRFRKAYGDEEPKTGIVNRKAKQAQKSNTSTSDKENTNTINKTDKDNSNVGEEFSQFSKKSSGRRIECHNMQTPNKSAWTKSMEATGQLWSTFSPFSSSLSSPRV